MRRLVLTATLLLSSLPLAAQQVAPCEVPAEPWRDAAQLESAKVEAGLAAARIEIGQALLLHLHPDGEVNYRSLPQGEGEAASFGGMVAVEVPVAGVYRVGIDRPAWVDVVSGSGPAEAVAFGPGPACSGLRKTVAFELAEGMHVLEISGSLDAEIGVVIEAVPS